MALRHLCIRQRRRRRHAHIYWDFSLTVYCCGVCFLLIISIDCMGDGKYVMIFAFPQWFHYLACVGKIEFVAWFAKRRIEIHFIDFVVAANILVVPPPPPLPYVPALSKLVIFDWNIKCINVNDIFKKPFRSYWCVPACTPPNFVGSNSVGISRGNNIIVVVPSNLVWHAFGIEVCFFFLQMQRKTQKQQHQNDNSQ